VSLDGNWGARRAAAISPDKEQTVRAEVAQVVCWAGAGSIGRSNAWMSSQVLTRDDAQQCSVSWPPSRRSSTATARARTRHRYGCDACPP
jgi:hypothetical protein